MIRTVLLSFLLISFLHGFVKAQDCVPPAITPKSKTYNIFSPEQEMILGELNYQRISSDLRFIRDPELIAYLDKIITRLIRHLPPIGLTFRVHIVDIPEANAFNIPGGHVFVSRKLIAFTNNEDELAGVLAHELGHAVVRHSASDLSELFKRIHNITEVLDRRDITEKYNLFLERWRTKRFEIKSGHESEQQLEADRIGLFAMVAAGYDPAGFAAFFDRLADTKGKTGSWFGDIFGKQKPEQKRLREMIKTTERLPSQCRENLGSAGASADYLKWQADVVSYRARQRKEDLPALRWKKELSPRLRSDISHISFSSDGRYVLAQDDFAITILSREPFQVVFQIPADQARSASFTPDGNFIVFGTEGLRFEKWSIEDERPVEVRELVIRRDCWEHKFSPDGKYLACVDYARNLNVLDTQIGKSIWEHKNFYELSFWEYFTWISALASGKESLRTNFFVIEFSPDSRYVTFSRSNNFRFRVRIDGMVAASTEKTLLALDLSTLKPINTGGDLKKLTQRSFVFLDSERVLGMASNDLEGAGVFSFPRGKRVAKLRFACDELKRTSNPKYILLKPLKNAKLGIYDLELDQLVSGLNKEDAAIWNNVIAYEDVSGALMLSEFRYDEQEKNFVARKIGAVEIPISTIGELETAQISDSFEWLAISFKSRGGMWNLKSGERKIFSRGFKGALVGNDGGGIADFPKLEETNHSLVLMNPFENQMQVLREIPEKGARQFGQFVLLRQSLKEPQNNNSKKSEDQTETSVTSSLHREVRFELRNVITDKLVWSYEFPKEAPGFFFDEFSGRLIFYWTLSSDVGKNRLKENPTLAAQARQMGIKDDDYLMEVVDAFAGKTAGTFLLETGKGSIQFTSGFSEGDWLILNDSGNRVLVYSLKDGDLKHRFFGSRTAINPSGNQILVENYPGELTVYELVHGEPVARLVFSSGAAFVRFSLDGKNLFVLSSEQIAYAFDMEKLMRQASLAQQSP